MATVTTYAIVSPGRTRRRAAASSVGPIAKLSGLPASLHRTRRSRPDRRTSSCESLLATREIRHERARVERVEAEARGDLLARRLRPLCEQVAQDLARLRSPPPVLAHLAHAQRAQQRR